MIPHAFRLRVVYFAVTLSGLAAAPGCMVVKPVVGAGAAVAGAAVKTTAKATGAVVDAAIPDEQPAKPADSPEE